MHSVTIFRKPGAVGIISDAVLAFLEDEAVQCQALLALRMVLEFSDMGSEARANIDFEGVSAAVQQSLDRRADSDGDMVLHILRSKCSQVQILSPSITCTQVIYNLHCRC